MKASMLLVALGCCCCLLLSQQAAGARTLNLDADMHEASHVDINKGTRELLSACSWSGHCLGDPCRTYNDCDGNLICTSGHCSSPTSGPTPSTTPSPTSTCSWPGHCLGATCSSSNDCDGNLICTSGKCSSPTSGTTPTPTPSPTTTPSTGCPAGWSEAVGTVYDSWPKPGTTECIAYSGCRWAGEFNSIDGGSPPNHCINGAQYLDGGSGVKDCRFPDSLVRSWSVASTYDMDPSLLHRKLQVMVQGRSTVVTVNVLDVCSDSDCGGCCKTNTGNKAYKLLDLEKWPASALLGFDATSSTFDVNNLNLPQSTGAQARPGAPEKSVMPLCYRDVGAAVSPSG